MTCEVCGKGPQAGVTVFRANEKGVDGIWRCRQHLNGVQVDPLVQELVDIISPPKPGTLHDTR